MGPKISCLLVLVGLEAKILSRLSLGLKGWFPLSSLITIIICMILCSFFFFFSSSSFLSWYFPLLCLIFYVFLSFSWYPFSGSSLCLLLPYYFLFLSFTPSKSRSYLPYLFNFHHNGHHLFLFLSLYAVLFSYCFFQISSLNPLDLSWPHVLCLYAFFLIFFSFLCFFLSRLLTYFSLFESLLLSFLLSLSLPLSSLSSSSSLLWLIAALTPIVKYLHRSIADVIRADLLSAPVTWPRPTSARPGFQLPSAWRHPWLIGDVIGYAH